MTVRIPPVYHGLVGGDSMSGMGVLALVVLAQVAVSGQVVDPRNQPVQGAQVRVRPNEGGKTVTTITKTDGHFSLTLPAARSVFCEVSALGYGSARELAVVKDGAARLMTLRLKPALKVGTPLLVSGEQGTEIQIALVNNTNTQLSVSELILHGGLAGEQDCGAPGIPYLYAFIGPSGEPGSIQVDVEAPGVDPKTRFDAEGFFNQHKCGGSFSLTARSLLPLSPGVQNKVRIQLPQPLSIQRQDSPTDMGKLYMKRCQKNCVPVQVTVSLSGGGQVTSEPALAAARVER